MSRNSLELRSGEFLRPRLHGARFKDGSVSLDVLGELDALREMVREVARWRFLEANPWRQRSPRGFNSIDLRLTDMDCGSAVPVISLIPDERLSGAAAREYQRYYERAREDIVDVIGAAEYSDSQAPNVRFPNRCLVHFNRIGRSLRDDEWIELLTPNRDHSVVLTKQSCRRLHQWSLMTEVSGDVTLRGAIYEADQARMTFELQTLRGPKVSGPIPREYLESVMGAFNRYTHGEKVIVQGTGRYDEHRRLSNLESVERVILLGPLDVPSRLDEFRKMKNGWLEGDGLAPNHDGLDWLSTSFDHHYPNDVALPHTFPTPAGGVEMEWSFGSQSVILEIDLEEQLGDWLRFDNETDEEYSNTLNLSDSTKWEWVATEIRRLEGAPE